jgi:hypothetical protein
VIPAVGACRKWLSHNGAPDSAAILRFALHLLLQTKCRRPSFHGGMTGAWVHSLQTAAGTIFVMIGAGGIAHTCMLHSRRRDGT